MIVKIHRILPIKIDDEEAHYLQLKDIAFAEPIDESTVLIQSGKYNNQTISLLNESYKEENHRLICEPKEYQFKEEEVEKLKNLFDIEIKENEFKKINTKENRIFLEFITDEKLVKIIENNFSLDDKKNEILDSLVSNLAAGASSIKITTEQTDILLNHFNKKNVTEETSNEDIIENNKVDIVSNEISYDLNEIYNHSKKIIVGQDEALKLLLGTIDFNMDIQSHFYDLDEIADLKKTILLCGSTGTGKTLMIKTLAKQLRIPYIIEDASRYTAAGYEGASTDELLKNLVSSISKSKVDALKSAQSGIIFIDEIDKLRQTEGDKYQVGTTAVQESLLKLIEGTIIRTKIREGFIEEKFEFDTRKLTFVLSGAFQDLLTNGEKISDEKLIKSGIVRELVARISPTIQLRTPTKEDLKCAIINSERSYLKQLIKYFNAKGIECSQIEDYADYIAEYAFKLNDGYRGIKKAIDMNINDDLFNLMAGNQKKLEFVKK